MKFLALSSIAATLALTSFAQAQDFVQDPDLLRIATQSGVCEDRSVVKATLQDDASILAECEVDPTAFIPLIGGLAPLLGLGAAAVVAVAAAGGGGTATPDTQ